VHGTACDSNPCDNDRTDKTEGRRHELYTDNFFSSPELYDDFANKQIYCCGIVRPNRSCMLQDTAPKTIKLKRGNIHIRTRADLMAILWCEKRYICMLMNIHDVPAEGNYCNEGGRAIKLQIVMYYNHHIGYVDTGDRLANNYSISHRTFKWTKKMFIHLLEMAIPNSYILNSSCEGKKISHRLSIYPHEKYVGTCWTRTDNMNEIKQTS
jgi:hypothetical protein